jgi:hypothetical protein
MVARRLKAPMEIGGTPLPAGVSIVPSSGQSCLGFAYLIPTTIESGPASCST